jgi:tetratricopeptide (TPR) repeat protein
MKIGSRIAAFLRGLYHHVVHFIEDISELFTSLPRGLPRLDWGTVPRFFAAIPSFFAFLYRISIGLIDDIWHFLFGIPQLLESWEPERRLRLYRGFPSLAIVIVLLGAFAYSLAISGSIANRYRTAMQQAMVASDFKQAAILGGRLVSQREQVDPATRMTYALALQQSGEVTRGEAILADLAPDDQPGFQPAHRLRAASVASQLRGKSDTEILDRLRWHLENSGSELNATVEKLWTAYYVTVGQPELGIPHMEAAAQADPKLYSSLANLFSQVGNKPAENRALREAEAYLLDRLEADPLLREERIQLAITQVRLGKWEPAEATILQGVQLHDDETMRRSAAEYYLYLYDQELRDEPENMAMHFELLQKALGQDAFFIDIYERLITFYRRALATEEAEKVRHQLEALLIEGKSPALAHFALGSIYQLQGNTTKSQFHFFQAYRLDARYPVITNNLAWAIAQSPEADLPRALELAQNAVRASPQDPRFRETLATVLMKMGRDHEAVAEFEAILSVAADPASIHRNLGELYGKLDQAPLAQKHREKAEELIQAKQRSQQVTPHPRPLSPNGARGAR